MEISLGYVWQFHFHVVGMVVLMGLNLGFNLTINDGDTMDIFFLVYSYCLDNNGMIQEI